MKYKSLQEFLSNNRLVRDLRTIVTFLLAASLSIISNGFINGFETQNIISLVVTFGTIGMYISFELITAEFSNRGYLDEKDENEELKKLILEHKTASKNIDNLKASKVLMKYNKDKIESMKNEELEKRKNALDSKILNTQNRIDTLTSIGFKWFQISLKFKIGRLRKNVVKYQNRKKRLSINKIAVRYKPIELQHLRLLDISSSENKWSEYDRYNITPEKRTRRQMKFGNVLKTFFFFGFQGAIISVMGSWVEILIFIFLTTLSLIFTALFSYTATRRFTSGAYINLLEDKVKMVKWLENSSQKA